MLLSRPSYATRMNAFGEVWAAHKSLDSSNTNSMGQIPRFNTPRFV
jgi:hypothetical protein